MITLLPEPKKLVYNKGFSYKFKTIGIRFDACPIDEETALELIRLRFWNRKDIAITSASDLTDNFITLTVSDLPDAIKKEYTNICEQGYAISIEAQKITLCCDTKAGFIYGVTTIKELLVEDESYYLLPLCEIADYPSVPVRAVAPTFSWYAGYGRIGFDSQLWGFDEWSEFLQTCVDNKINQLNMVMYGYWPFELEKYPETVLQNVPIKIWNAENRRWMTVRYSHPNLEEPFLDKLIELAHKMEVKLFAYVGLNSYNGGYSIKHPEARTKAPDTGQFLNDFDSLCLSHPGTVDYILHSMEQITRLGFDGFTLEESEEGFWYCECDECKNHWHAMAGSPGEAKHQANMWLLNEIYKRVRSINPNAVIGIRAFRQPPLEKSPEFLKECVESMPDDIMLFWAPGLYVPETEFPKWCDAFGKHRIWARDTESNSITSTMGRLYRIFESNMLRYHDEANVQVIERDIEQHIGSVKMGVHGINGFMFEWYGLFMHLFAHGNYGWGSEMDQKEFFKRACTQNFGEEMGKKVLYVLQNMLTIHESQIPLYTTPFPFQKNKIKNEDIPEIKAAIDRHPQLLKAIEELRDICIKDERLLHWRTHFEKLHNAERRNRVIYDLVLTALRYEDETDPVKKDALLDELLYYNERDFDIAKEMFFDINPVGETGVKSCMFPYHELKRLVHNIRHPENPDDAIICSGIEALGWLWL